MNVTGLESVLTQVLDQGLLFAFAGLVAGILAGFLGIGGGTVLVPFLVALNYSPVQSVATSSLSILITSISGSWQNWRMGYFSFQRVLPLGIPAIITAQIGAAIADLIHPYYLLFFFALLLWLNIYLVNLRQKVTAQKKQEEAEAEKQSVAATPHSLTANSLTSKSSFQILLFRLFTGGSAGILAGLFGVGGGVIMVPLQILLLGERIKTAIQTSLGVIVITSISACFGHFLRGNVLWLEGILLGIGGLVGAQISTRFLPKLSDQVVSLSFRSLLAILSLYIFWQAWQSYTNSI